MGSCGANRTTRVFGVPDGVKDHHYESLVTLGGLELVERSILAR